MVHQNKIIIKGSASWSISGCPVLPNDALDLASSGCQRAMAEVVTLNVRGVAYQRSLATLEHWANTQSQCWQPPQNWKKKMKMDCTSLSDRDGELFRYTYCFLRLKYGNILENCSEMEGSFVICIKL